MNTRSNRQASGTNTADSAPRLHLLLCAARRYIRAAAFCIATAVLLSAVGCSDTDADRLPVFPVQGQITFDGQPAAGAFVVVHPKNSTDPRLLPARAIVEKDGTFALSTYESKDGAAAGVYNVTVEWRKLVKNGNDYAAGPNVLPKKYAAPSTSKIEINVAEGVNQLDPIKLKR